jgi:chromosome segregation ATPase
MSKTPKERESEFLQAALTVDRELVNFQGLVDATTREKLNSAKSLERAAASLQEVAQSEERLGVALKTMSSALTRAHQQQQEQAQRSNERAAVVSARSAEFQRLTEGYRTIGTAAVELNQLMSELVRKKKESGGKPPDIAFPDEIQVLIDRLSEVATTATGIMEAARAADFEEVARQVDSIRQQLLSARNKLSLLGRQILH